MNMHIQTCEYTQTRRNIHLYSMGIEVRLDYHRFQVNFILKEAILQQKDRLGGIEK